LKTQRNIIFNEGLPNIGEIDTTKPNLIIIDDLMRESDNRVVDLFTRGCHHRNLSVFFITQNIFHQGKGQRDISLNAHYIVLFKNPRDKAQIKHLAQQVCPENVKFLQESYRDATDKAHGYLLLDLKQSTPEDFRFRTNIFPSDEQQIVYVQKFKYK
jgi:chemotaxis response regulator CheB